MPLAEDCKRTKDLNINVQRNAKNESLKNEQAIEVYKIGQHFHGLTGAYYKGLNILLQPIIKAEQKHVAA